jgi:mono/diheme cytochrome c family protein
MADVQLLGLFREVDSISEVVSRLHELGVPDEKMSVMSGIPYKPEILGRPHPRGGIGRFALLGALLGLLTALLLTIGTVLLYPQTQGGQPLIPVPPTLIIVFELTMLGTMWVTFFSLVLSNRLPNLDPQAYDPEITEGAIGLLVHVEAERLSQVEALLTAQGAHRCQRVDLGPQTGRRRMWFWTAVGVAAVVALAAGLALAYDVIKLPIPSNMVDQVSIDYQQGPRLAAPSGAVPIQGPDLIGGQPASQPHAVTSESLQRGKVLFDINCALCHGPAGKGDGKIGAYFVSSLPADLTSQKVQNLPDTEIFLVITQGRGAMPSLAENLAREDRWDVVNYVRQLKK